MHERDDPKPRRRALDFVRQHAERQAVDDDDAPCREVRQNARRLFAFGRGRRREPAAQLPHVDPPPVVAQRLDQTPIVFVAARSGVEAPGHDEHYRAQAIAKPSVASDARAHSCVSRQSQPTAGRPSNDADATCDSCSVTRTLSIAFASRRPSAPRRTAAARRSKTTRARNSVVVLRPANAGSSSRFRYDNPPTTCRDFLARTADVDHDAVRVEVAAPELDVDDVGRAVQPLRGAEHLSAKAVGDHHVIADGDAVHGR